MKVTDIEDAGKIEPAASVQRKITEITLLGLHLQRHDLNFKLKLTNNNAIF